MALAACLALLLAAQVGQAGTRRHDVDDSVHLDLGAQQAFACVGLLQTASVLGSGTLIAPNYVLTAAHVAESTGAMTYSSGSASAGRAWDVIHPNWTGSLTTGWDIALVRLSSLVLDIAPAELLRTSDEIGKVATTAGYGKSGTGLTGAIGPAGQKRAGENTLDVDGTYLGYSARIMLADFDNPKKPNNSWFGSTAPLPLEYMAAPGDSGGGTFISTPEGMKLAGVTSFITARDNTLDSDYGDAMGLIRVSMFTSWIDSVLATAYDMRWTGGGGDFNSPARWQTTHAGQTINAVPGPADRVILDSASQYSIAFPAASLFNDRLLAAAGVVTLNLNGAAYSLTNASAATPSLTVGHVSGTQQLTVTNGTLTTVNTWIGAVAGATSVLSITAAGSTWTNSGAVYVGGTDTAAGGSGQLSIGSGSSGVVAGRVKVWPGGSVQLNGGSLSAMSLDLDGGTLMGYGTFNSPITLGLGGGTIDVPGDSMLDLNGPISDYSESLCLAPAIAALGEAMEPMSAVADYPPAPAPSALPEPASILLLAVAGAAALARRPRSRSPNRI